MKNKKNYGQNQIGSKKEELSHSTIKFKAHGKNHKFEVLSNVPEFIEPAFVNGASRIEDEISLIDFCRYVESKDVTFICHPKSRREINS